MRTVLIYSPIQKRFMWVNRPEAEDYCLYYGWRRAHLWELLLGPGKGEAP